MAFPQHNPLKKKKKSAELNKNIWLEIVARKGTYVPHHAMRWLMLALLVQLNHSRYSLNVILFKLTGSSNVPMTTSVLEISDVSRSFPNSDFCARRTKTPFLIRRNKFGIASLT